MELDLATVVPSCSGPKRPHDRVPVSEMKKDFNECLIHKVGFKGYGLPPNKLAATVPFIYEGKEYTLRHGESTFFYSFYQMFPRKLLFD